LSPVSTFLCVFSSLDQRPLTCEISSQDATILVTLPPCTSVFVSPRFFGVSRENPLFFSCPDTTPKEKHLDPLSCLAPFSRFSLYGLCPHPTPLQKPLEVGILLKYYSVKQDSPTLVVWRQDLFPPPDARFIPRFDPGGTRYETIETLPSEKGSPHLVLRRI